MFECDCTHGYELNLDGYGCRPANISNNSTSSHETKLDEDYSSSDVFYQKGVSFSAKLEDFEEHENNNDVSNDLKQQDVDNQRCNIFLVSRRTFSWQSTFPSAAKT